MKNILTIKKNVSFCILFLCLISTFSINCIAQTAFNDPDEFDLSTIPEDKFMYFDIVHNECSPNNTLDTYPNDTAGNTKIYIDEINSCAYVLNLFSFGDYDRAYPWIKMKLYKDNSAYILTIDKFSINLYSNGYTTFEYFNKSEINEYITSINDNSINPIDYPNKNEIIFRLDNESLEMIIPEDQILLTTYIGPQFPEPYFGGIDVIKGSRIFPNILPEDCITEDWTMTYTHVRYINEDMEAPLFKRLIKIGFSGDDVYLGELEDGFINCWLKGKLNAGKITIPNHQLWFTSGMGNLSFAPDWMSGRSYALYFTTANMSIRFVNYYSYNNLNSYECGEPRKELTIKQVNEDLTLDYDDINGIICNPSSDFLFYNYKNESYNFFVDMYEFLGVKDDKCLFSDVYITKGDTTAVDAVNGEKIKAMSKTQRIFNLQGIQLNGSFNDLPTGIYVVLDQHGSHLIKK